MLISVVAVFAAIIAIYHFTIAGMIVLDGYYGILLTRVIVGSIYALVTLIALLALRMRRRRSNGLAVDALGANKAASSPSGAQIIMLAEAAMLGYQMARKSARTR